MSCTRCQGLMAMCWLCDGNEWERAWRCFNCGNVVDAMILVNHHRVIEKATLRRHGRRRLHATD